MISRADKLEQSVSDYVREGLLARDYGPDLVTVREEFPSPEERATQMPDTSQVAIGFNFDDGGKAWELGSDLTRFLHTIEIWVFGTDMGSGRNIAQVVRQILYSNEYLVPLKDIGVVGQPVIDQLVVVKAVVQRQISGTRHPWDQYVFSATAQIEDFWYPSLEA